MDLVCVLSRKLKADYIILASVDDRVMPEIANTMIVYSQDKYLENFQYNLKGTPCEQVVNKETCVFPEGVAGLFPGDVMLEQMGIEGYAGVPLRNRTGKTVGILVALFETPIRDPEKVYEALESHTDWASAEVVRADADKKFLDSDERFRTAFELSPDIMCITDIEDGTFVDVNEECCSAIGYSRDEMIGTPALELGFWHHPEERKVVIESARQSNYVKNMEVEFKIKDGSIRVGLLSATVINVGEKSCFFTVIKDITERKQLEIDLRSVLKEKDFLFKELHHRVKNNLQMITSLLKMQSDHIESSACKEVLKTCGERILSMSAIHEQLSHSKGLGEIDFGIFLEDLAESLINSHTGFSGVISHNIETEGTLLNIKSAIPCGMVVNELVSNALKHAFPQGRRGTITISLRVEMDDIFEIRVADDGVGIPSDLEIRNTDTLGMQLVFMLVERQLNGIVGMAVDKGTVFTVRFRKRIDDGHGSSL